MSKPPAVPGGVPIRVDNATISAGAWSAPAKGTVVQTVDGTGKRITATRIVALGPLALAARKKTGRLTMVLAAADGSTTTVSVKPGKAQAATAWAIAFNAWSSAP
ncbi:MULTISPECIES: hypothetical protein [Streptomycetaceae]|uniref:hypothetical protein n=1 Tax=Streptomycetaceae TaxID=2062 RepID=UPI003009B5CC